MNKPPRPSDLDVPNVTTGPLPASSKVYSSPAGHPDVRVPLREIALSPNSGEAPVRVYDPSGPYTQADAHIEVAAGLPRHREAWIRERGGVEQYDGRAVKPEDNGNVTGARSSETLLHKHSPGSVFYLLFGRSVFFYLLRFLHFRPKGKIKNLI